MTNHDVAVATPSNDDERGAAGSGRSRSSSSSKREPTAWISSVRAGCWRSLTKQVLETGLEVEMEEHLGYDKHAAEGRNGGNSRNGTRSKTVITEVGPVDDRRATRS